MLQRHRRETEGYDGEVERREGRRVGKEEGWLRETEGRERRASRRCQYVRDKRREREDEGRKKRGWWGGIH